MLRCCKSMQTLWLRTLPAITILLVDQSEKQLTACKLHNTDLKLHPALLQRRNGHSEDGKTSILQAKSSAFTFSAWTSNQNSTEGSQKVCFGEIKIFYVVDNWIHIKVNGIMGYIPQETSTALSLLVEGKLSFLTTTMSFLPYLPFQDLINLNGTLAEVSFCRARREELWKPCRFFISLRGVKGSPSNSDLSSVTQTL